MSSSPAAGPPILIGGFYRSGTSLLRRLIDGHPNIHCPPEIKLLKDFNGDYIDDTLAHVRFFRSLRSLGLGEQELLQATGDYYRGLRHAAAGAVGKHRWADKDPEHLLHLDQLESIAPGFLLVICLRDPRDVLASLREVVFALTVPTDDDERIRLLARQLANAAAFQEQFPERIHKVSYEELVRDPAQQIRGVLDFVREAGGADVIEAMLAGVTESARGSGLEDPKGSTRQGIDTSSVGRWRGELTPAAATAVVAATRTQLDRLEYPWAD